MLDHKHTTRNLAAYRTELAVERTILSYLRTSLTLLVVGVSFIELLVIPFLTMMGWVLVAASPILFVFGTIRCKHICAESDM